MAKATTSQFSRRGTYSRGTVRCPKCSGAIHIYKVTAVGEEFSLTCRSCGARSFHSPRDMSVEHLPERRAKTRAA